MQNHDEGCGSERRRSGSAAFRRFTARSGLPSGAFSRYTARMAKPNKDRIPTSGPQAGLNAAFAGLPGLLDTTQLPDAPPKAAGEKPAAVAKPGRVVLRREKAHRGGKTVVVVHDFAPHISAEMIAEIAACLRKACGCGGTVRGREIEVQGDQPAKIRALLEGEGFRVAGV
jgi:translation initiation factor 1